MVLLLFMVVGTTSGDSGWLNHPKIPTVLVPAVHVTGIAVVRHLAVSGEPSHFGSAAYPAGSTGLSTATVSIGSGKDHVMP
ncbi:hypothetical protein GCM10022284_68270 [Streptomyces hundungensis]